MPFTISHAAAVLPLQKTRLPLAALMIGSMSPDYAYFLPGEPLREQTHSIVGIFWFCWPVGLALWLLFVRVLEQPTLALLPENWRAKFPSSEREITLTTVALASVAVMLGAATHIIWDSFTHRGTDVVGAIPALHSVAFHVNGWRVRWFVVLQHLSSAVGMLALLIWVWRRPPIHRIARMLPPVSHVARIRSVAIVLASSLVVAIVSYLLNSDTWFMRRLFHLAIGGMTGFALAWLATAIFIDWHGRAAARLGAKE